MFSMSCTCSINSPLHCINVVEGHSKSTSDSKANDDSVSKDQPTKAHKTREDTSDGAVVGDRNGNGAEQGNEKQLSGSYKSTEPMSGTCTCISDYTILK